MSDYVIYGLVDPFSDELRYVGKTTRGVQRLWEHVAPCRLARETNRHKINWLRKLRRLGTLPKFVVLEKHACEGTLNAAEIAWIAKYTRQGKRLLNATSGGDGLSGYTHSNATRRRMSLRNKGTTRTTRSAEHRRKLSEARTGKCMSPTAKEHMSLARKGRTFAPLTKEHRARIAIANGARPFKDQNGVTYVSQRAAARLLGLDSSAIAKVLRGRIASTKGYVFTYVT